jgi:CheY-like chemotaxis protein
MPIILAADATPAWVTTAIWAVVLLIFLVLFRAPLTKLIEGLAEFSFKANSSGVEASFRRQQAEAAASLAAASASRPSGDVPPTDAKAIAETVERSVPRSEAKRFSRATVLWVDDRPDNNTYERRAFEAVGFHFTLAKSTEEALAILKERKFSAIISDMGRPPDPQAGYTLLSALRSSGDNTPFIIYAGSDSPEHKRMAQQRGAQGSTNNPQELFRLVTSAIIDHSESDRNG